MTTALAPLAHHLPSLFVADAKAEKRFFEFFSFIIPGTLTVFSPGASAKAPWILLLLTVAAFFACKSFSHRLARRYEAQISTWFQSRSNDDAHR